MKLLLHSPVSLLLAEYDRETLHSLRFWRQGVHPPADTRDAPARGDTLGHHLLLQIEEYFGGSTRPFDGPPRRPSGRQPARRSAPFPMARRAATQRSRPPSGIPVRRARSARRTRPTPIR